MADFVVGPALRYALCALLVKDAFLNGVPPFHHHALQPLSAFFVCSVSGVTLSAVCSYPDAWVVVGVLLCLVLTACTDLSGEEASYFFWRELDLMTFRSPCWLIRTP